MSIAFLIILFGVLCCVNGFNRFTTSAATRVNALNLDMKLSFKEQLAQAKAAKGGKPVSSSPPKQRRAPEPQSSSAGVSGNSANDDLINSVVKNPDMLGEGSKGFPFNDEMYDNLTFVIKTFTERMKAGGKYSCYCCVLYLYYNTHHHHINNT